VEIVVSGRNVEVPEHFRVHVAEKMARLERYDHKIVGMEVELFHERNPRQSKSCQRIEITGRGSGPTARAEACAPDFYAALDIAIGKLESRLRRAHDRRRVHYGRRNRALARLTGGGPRTAVLDPPVESVDRPDLPDIDELVDIPVPRHHEDAVGARPGRIVRSKVHNATPMTVDDALSRMELVGHDFYLFLDSATRHPAVVYRRRGYDYGVIRLA
jgi:ribosomal subunit interface protein